MCDDADVCICRMKLDAILAVKAEEVNRHRSEMVRICNEEGTLRAQIKSMVGERRKLKAVK